MRPARRANVGVFILTTTTSNTGTAPAMFSVREFCKTHAISRAFLYKMHRDGKGPRFAKCGSRTLISAESAAEWRKGLEAAA
jgi:predicted DNA-binding transcriptional regulator AlpA